MNNQEIIVGLDIGTTKICAIVGVRNEYDKLEVLGMGKAVSDGVNRGIVTNIDKTVRAIEKAIEEAEEQSGITINVVNVGIAGQHIRSSIQHGSITCKSGEEQITIEDVNRLTEDMYRVVTPPGNQIIHVMPQDYTVDFEDGIMDPVGHTGVKLEADFHIITAQTNAINNINKCVKRANLKIQNLILEPLASSLAVLSEEEKEAGVCLVDIGGGTTDIAIFHDNIIRHTAVIPFGGNIVTNDIKQGCMVLAHQAEQLKTKFGRAIAEEANEFEIVSIPGMHNRPPKEISLKNLAYIIEARMQEIISMVYQEIQDAGYAKKLAGGIVVTGGGSQLQNLQQLFEYSTGMDTRIGHPNEHLGKCKIDDVKSPMYATSIGLVLSGFKALDERSQYWGGSVESRMTGNHAAATGKKKEGYLSGILKNAKRFILDDFENEEEY